MKRLMSYLSAAAVLVLSAAGPSFAVPVGIPEPGTLATIGAIAVGGLIARKILKRK